MIYQNRTDAGRQLAERLARYADRADVIVLALPRGGVPVGFEVAAALHVPLDVFIVRKLGVPGHEELAMGAIATGGVLVRNEDVIAALGVPEEVLDAVATEESAELERREELFRGDRPPPDVRGRIVILVDDGLATGSTMRAAIAALRRQDPERIVMAAPVAAEESCIEISRLADETVCPQTPEPFLGVGRWYDDFTQTTDDEVRAYLARARQIHGAAMARSHA